MLAHSALKLKIHKTREKRRAFISKVPSYPFPFGFSAIVNGDQWRGDITTSKLV